MKRKILKYILPFFILSALPLVSCFDMYNEILDNTGDKYRLAVADTDINNSRLLAFKSDGTIYQLTSITTGSGSLIKTVFADFNKDGRTDIFVLFSSFTEASQISYGDGKGNFGNTYLLPVSSQNVDAAVADFDNNGYPDIFYARNGGGNLYILNNKSLSYSMFFPPVSNPATTIISADFDNDGDFDIFTGNAALSTSELWINSFNTGGSFTQRILWTLDTMPTDGAVDNASADLDNDGDIDIIESYLGGTATLRVWINDGKGYFKEGWTDSTISTPASLALADFDCDGDTDVFVGTANPTNYVLFNNGKGQFTPVAQSSTDNATLSAAAGDLDMDGDIDIIYTGFIAAGPVRTLRILTNNGTGTFLPGNTFPGLTANNNLSAGAIFR